MPVDAEKLLVDKELEDDAVPDVALELDKI